MFIIMGFASALHGQTPQNPLPISGPMTITAPGYYRFTRNVIFAGLSGTVITIKSHNVTIDFNTFAIVAPSNKGNTVIGISANEYGNLTIKNGTIAFCEIGIEFNGNSSSTTKNINQVVDNMRISNCWEYGIFFLGASPGSIVSNSLFSQIGGSTAGLPNSIAVFGNGDVLIKDNVINTVTDPSGSPNQSYGIAFGFAVRNTIANSYHGVYLCKFQNNLTFNCTFPFVGGTDAGANN
jgi:hypothetical protein